MSASRNILITGVSKGLGRIMALRLASLGHRIDGCGRSRDTLDELSEELAEHPTAGKGHHLRAVDVSDEAQVQAWADEVLAAGRIPDLVLNNAAVITRRAPLWEISAQDFSNIIDINIKGVANVIRSFVPAMVERQSGVVINFSSGWGHSTAPHVAPYCATKFAIEGLTQAMAQELPEGMAAIPLSPGIIHTEMLDTAMGTDAESFPSPEAWVDDAVPYILSLGVADNGRSRRVPGH